MIGAYLDIEHCYIVFVSNRFDYSRKQSLVLY